MKKFITYDNALRELENLNRYVALIESYKADTLEKWIILEYSKVNSISKVIKSYNNLNKHILTPEIIKEVILSKPIDELHRIVHLGYKKKISYRSKK